MGYGAPAQFNSGEIDVSSRLNTMRSNDASRADGGDLQQGDDHGHQIIEFITTGLTSINSSTWYPITFTKSFKEPPIVFLEVEDQQNPGKWAFQTDNKLVSRCDYASVARNISTTGCDVRAEAISNSFINTVGRAVVKGV
jgi:hypothetical protein